MPINAWVIKMSPLNYGLVDLSTDIFDCGWHKQGHNKLVKNDVAYINSFLNAGLDRLVKIDGRSILTEAIAIDNSDAVQTILNKYIEANTYFIQYNYEKFFKMNAK